MPTSQNLFLDQDFVELLDEELQSYIVPFLLSFKEEYLVTHKDYDVSGGVKEFELPDDSVGKRARSICLLVGEEEVEIPRIQIPERANTIGMPSPNGYSVMGDNIVVKGDISGVDGLRIYYYKRPNKLVLESDGGRILSINTGTNEVTFDAVPSVWTVNTRLDLIKGKPSFKTKRDDFVYTNKSGFTLTFDSISDMEVGDYVTMTGHSQVAQIPWELHKLLAQAVAVKCLDALGDAQGVQVAGAKMQLLEQKAVTLVTGRVDGNAKVISGKRTIWGY